ncbi:MAG: YdeI/OmpD-associated family protein [Hyphomicrobiaceae bacterium]
MSDRRSTRKTPPAAKRGDHARIEVTSRAELRGWLTTNHSQTESIWLVTWKKATGDKHLPYAAIVDEALCFGWIDSLPRKLDETRTMLRLSPRKPRSAWSQVNKDKVAALMAAGLMTPAGLAKIQQAKSDGSWDALNEVETLSVPADLAAGLAKNAAARDHFDAFPRSVKRGILEWIASARQPETRQRRIAETVAKAAENLRANHPRQLKRPSAAVKPGKPSR